MRAGSISLSLPLRDGEDEVEATLACDYGILTLISGASPAATHLWGHLRIGRRSRHDTTILLIAVRHPSGLPATAATSLDVKSHRFGSAVMTPSRARPSDIFDYRHGPLLLPLLLCGSAGRSLGRDSRFLRIDIRISAVPALLKRMRSLPGHRHRAGGGGS